MGRFIVGHRLPNGYDGGEDFNSSIPSAFQGAKTKTHMGLLDKLLGRAKFNRFEDSFAIDRASLWPTLRTSIETQLNDGHAIWIVAHFADTLFKLQSLLDEWEVGHQIADREIHPQAAHEVTQNLGGIVIVLADLMVPSEAIDREFDASTSLAIIAIERHPMVENDQRIERFAKSIPCYVRFGYFLTIEDVVVRRAVSETMVQLLVQMGMRDHQLITSNMMTRRIETVLKREAKSFSSFQRADSAEDWYRLNESND